MRCALPLLAFLVWVAPAHGAPSVTIQTSTTLGAAPLDVTLAATGDAVAYHWNLGDKTEADGSGVQHRYEAGRYTATVTATGTDGSTAQASVTITSVKLTLAGQKVGTYGKRTTLRGRIVPTLRGAPIALYSGAAAVKSGKVNREGRFRFRVRHTKPSSYSVRFETIASNAVAVAVRPGLDVALPRTRMLGQPLVLHARLKPEGSGTLEVRTWRGGRELRTRSFAESRPAAPEHEARHRLRRPDQRQAEGQLPRPAARLPDERLRSLPRSRCARPERANPRAAPRAPRLRTTRSGHVLLLRHRRRGPRLPKGARPYANGAREPHVLAPTPGRAGARCPLPGRRRPRRGRQVAPGPLRSQSVAGS